MRSSENARKEMLPFEVIVTTVYCNCKTCVKYCCDKEPVKCIDPRLMHMWNTCWITHGLKTTYKTNRPKRLKNNLIQNKSKRFKPEHQQEKCNQSNGN
ncbi:hypothetical protein B5X24_HaOG202090 [Helicoverpa armigera]|uniref:Uncharacterized protein n=1 Tax=Helicoverpa armigera TaxID=29058 RepID=A0A2W1BY26_HELAM|nr:hypothetical protein B5X24_HaOG202090 [Helicoverpa armigera]